MNSDDFNNNLMDFDSRAEDSSGDFNKIQVFVDSGAGFIAYTNKIKMNSLNVTFGTTYIKAIALAGIPVEQVGFLSVNGTKKEKSALASDKDIIRPLPYIISG